MSKLSEHKSGEFVKLFVVGDSGVGKTGALISLVKAGYELRVLDFDVGIETLKSFILHECPERIDQVDVETLRDSFTNGVTGPKLKGSPRAFTRSVELLDKWSDGTKPEEWGPNHVLVLDSLTLYARSAFFFGKTLNPGSQNNLQHIGVAQDLVFNQLATLMGADFKANVIINCHIDHREGATKDYIASIGKALGPKLPALINTMVLAKSTGFGNKVERKLTTIPTSLLDLKNTAPFKLEASYPLETGLASIFAALRAG